MPQPRRGTYSSAVPVRAPWSRISSRSWVTAEVRTCLFVRESLFDDVVDQLSSLHGYTWRGDISEGDPR